MFRKLEHLEVFEKIACTSRSLSYVLIPASVVMNLIVMLQAVPCYNIHELSFLNTLRPSSVAKIVLIPVSLIQPHSCSS